MKKYFYSDEKEKFGPFSLEELKKEKITKETLIWFQGLDDWKPARDIDEIIEIFELIPPPIPSINIETETANTKISEDADNIGLTRAKDEKGNFNDIRKIYDEVLSNSPPSAENRIKPIVGGWLMFFCLALTVFSPLATLYNFITTYDIVMTLSESYPSFVTIFYIDSILGTAIMVLSIRAGVALWKVAPNAVRTARNYLLIYLGYIIISVFLPFMAGLPTEANEAMIPEVIAGAFKSLIFFGIWFTYLNVSKRVKETYNLI
jgi:hypothetical protein